MVLDLLDFKQVRLEGLIILLYFIFFFFFFFSIIGLLHSLGKCKILQ